MSRQSIAAAICVSWLGAATPAAQASFHTFAIDEIYSNADGSVQFIVLQEALGADGQNLLAGHSLTVTHGSVSKTFTFDRDLPNNATAGKRVLIATPAFATLNLAAPDYLIPSQFVAIDGGTIDYAGADRWTYPPLPIDGANALFRSGANAQNVATNFVGQSSTAPALPVAVVEYYNAALDHYFISSLAPDIDALDSGRTPGWSRTGQTFNAFPSQASGGSGVNPVCRFYIPPERGDSHFFSASPAECARVLQNIGTDPNYSGYAYESPDAFYIAPPDPIDSNCPAGTKAVYRLWNGRADSNHRYTTDRAIKAKMIALGYIAEGDGPDAISMCATTAPPATSEMRASGPTPFVTGCDGELPSGTVYANAEVEPSIAINPLDRNHWIGTWQQDRWSNGGARGLGTGVSFDAGLSWSRRFVPFSRCAGGNAANGGDYARATDPWVSFAPDGTAYQIAVSFSGNTFAPQSVGAVLVSRSVDGGLNWSNPTTLIRDGSNFFNDKESLTADPADARFVYAVWDRLDPGGNGPSYFTRTTDGGLTWEAARPIYDPGQNAQTINNQIVVLPDGTLVNFFTELAENRGAVSATMKVVRSGDKGGTWSPPITVAMALAVGTFDPETRTPIRDGSTLGAIAAGAHGELAVAWQDARFSGGGRDGVAFSQSFDGGVSWSVPIQVNRDPSVQAFVPNVAILADGTIGVTYYDLRGNTSDPTILQTDYWLAVSNDGSIWRESHLAGPFDLAIAPRASVSQTQTAAFLGDYQGMASAANRFVAFYVRTNDGDVANRTDVFAAVAGAVSGATAAAIRSASPIFVQPATSALPAAPLELTPELRQRVSDNIVRTIQRRISGWTLRGIDYIEATPQP